MLPQIINNMPIDDYHAHPAISKSGLDEIAKSPAHYQAYLSAEHKETEALIFGSAFHDCVLLPEVFAEQYITLPESINLKTKAGREQRDELLEQGKTILTSEQMVDIQAMRQAIKAHPKANALLTGGQPETSIFWTDINTNQDCRCRPDYLNPNGIIVDLKTTTNASPREFAKSMANFRYHVQDAFYCEGYYQTTGKYPKGFVFIAVEKKPPYGVACYSLSEEAKALGRELFQRDLATLQQARQSQQWQAYSSNIEILDLPAWAYN